MTPKQWTQVGEIFHDALSRPESERDEWVRSACTTDAAVLAEVLSLLESDAAAGAGFVERKLRPAVQSLWESDAESRIPKRAGPYRLVREIGRGGMGAVYLAERDDEEYRTEVAVKLIRRGMDTDMVLARFYRERQTLARLQHPSIARLLDGGTTPEGYPYIVMEYVDGQPIKNYCADHALTITARLKLFLQVAGAIEYAHRNFVVHRDLKPGNILVDKSGAAKLLDFGVCKLLQTPEAFAGPAPDSTIDAGARFLTPDYASPEQIQGEAITVASDVYSAAAVLYELLAGVKPHRFDTYTMGGIEKGICDNEILPPSTAAGNSAVARKLRGDLDNILLCALDKDPARRYESMERFADDIRRHLADEPVRARPDTIQYRVRKFVRRRSGLVAAAAAVLATMAVGVFASMRSARIANENLTLVRQLSNTFVFDVYDAVSELPGSIKARQIVVETGLRYLDNLARNASGDNDLRRELAAAYRRIGDVQGNVLRANVGNTTEALKSYQKALSLLDFARQHGRESRVAVLERITLHQRIGNVFEYTKSQDAAIASFRQGIAEAEAEIARRPEDVQFAITLASLYASSATATRMTGRYREARPEYVRGLNLLEKYQKTHADTLQYQQVLATVLSGIGLCDMRLGHLEDALKRYREAIGWRERAVRADPSNTSFQRNLMFGYSYIGDILSNPNLPNLGDAKGATEAYRSMLDVARRIHLADSADQRARSDYGIALSRVATSLPDSQALERAKLLREAIQLLEEVARVNPDDTSARADLAYNHNFLGDSYVALRDERAAILSYRRGLELAESLRDKGLASLLTARVIMYRKLGGLVAVRGERREAVDLAQRSREMAQGADPSVKGLSDETRKFLMPRILLANGTIYAALAHGKARQPGDAQEARRLLEQSLKEFKELEKLPVFSQTYRREMRLAETSLEKLR